MIDITSVRADTPGTEFVAHFNNAGASLMPAPVLARITNYLEEESRFGGYETADAHADDLSAVYDIIAGLIGADRSEIAIVESATRAWDAAFLSMRFEEGDRILTTTSEYASNVIAFLQVAERTGAVIEVIPDRPTGEIDVDALDAMIDDRVRLIAINHVPTNGGLVNPAAEVGCVANAHGIPYLLDACQSVGQMPIDVDEIGCDMLSATSRKFLRGPRGVGFLYVRDTMLDRLVPPVLDLHGARWETPDAYRMRSDAGRFEMWERSPALVLGMSAAAEYAASVGLDAIWDRVSMLAASLREALSALPGVTVQDIGAVKGAIVTFTLEGADAGAVKQALRDESINVSVVTPYSARFDMEARRLPNLVRASVHYFNSKEEIDRLAAAAATL
ncbi:MAG: aminotransferase class V-fold PLP-dependent enzyme [Actinomycetota bacterium]